MLLRSGQLAIYEAVSFEPPTGDPEPASRPSILPVKFVKVLSRAFDIQHPDEQAQEKSVLAELKKIQRLFIPFVTSPAPEKTFTGVFFTGDRPCWILGTDKGGIRVHSSGHAVVHSFTPCSLWESKGDFLLYTDEVRFPATKSARIVPTLFAHVLLLPIGTMSTRVDAGRTTAYGAALEIYATV